MILICPTWICSLVFEKFKEIFPSNSSSIFDISRTVFFGIIIPSKSPEKSLVSELLDNLWPSVATVEIKFLLWVDTLPIEKLTKLPHDYNDPKIKYDQESIEVLEVIKI